MPRLRGPRRRRAVVPRAPPGDVPRPLRRAATAGRRAEPTTFLDIAHQYEVLRLLRRLVDGGSTVVAVLHDLNQACRFADHLVAMRDGRVVAGGPPSEVVDAALVEGVFGLACDVVPDPVTGTPMVVPHA